MKLAIMQPYFFPYIGYFQLINAVDKYILYEHLSFIQQGWMNKNRVAIIKGSESSITVPIVNKKSKTMIRDVQISYSQVRDWRITILETLRLNYRKAAFFDDIFPLLKEILSEKYELLHELNSTIIIRIARYLDIQTEIVWDNHNYLSMEGELYRIYSDDEATTNHRIPRKVMRALMMCKNENADCFINAIGGRELYDKNEFAANGIELSFLKTDEGIQYKHFSQEFIPNLSIIDVLMHNGKEKTKELLTRYTLI